MSLFRKTTEAETLETVQAKLSTARDALGALEAELRERSLAAAMQDDPGKALEPMTAKVAKAAATVAALELAEAEAQRMEAKRLQMAADDQEKARRRSCGQHAGAARRAAIKIREALEQAVEAYDVMLAAAEQAEKQLTPQERTQLLGFGGLHGSLNDLIRTAMQQANGFRGSFRPIDRFPLVPTGRSGVPHGKHVSELVPLEDAVSSKLDLAGLLRAPGWLHTVSPPTYQRGTDVVGQVEAKAPRADEPPRPDFPEVELPPEVVEAQRIWDASRDHTPEQVSAAYQTLSRYGSHD